MENAVENVTIRNFEHDVRSIHIHEHVTSYLVVGGKKAMLVDTGWGTIDLRGIVESITSLPLVVANTHGHLDHIFGNWQFDEVLLHKEDSPMFEYDFTREKRKSALNRFGVTSPPCGLSVSEWLDAHPHGILPLNDIKEIDLGDRTIDVIETPGHTGGSVCFLDRKGKNLFCGDSLLAGQILLHFNTSKPLSVYRRSLEILREKSEFYDKLFPSHKEFPLGKEFLMDVIRAVDQIIEGKVRGETKEVHGRPCRGAMFGNFEILYREDKMGEDTL
ncbi:MAG TPA: MBL fold metallo-hydrolase [Spirochaetota bacterium]